MARLWNLIEAHYLITAFLAWLIIIETSKVVRQLLRAVQLHPDYHTHNHTTQVQNEGETEEDDDEISLSSIPQSSSNPMLTHPRPHPLPRPGRGSDLVSSPGLLTRAERVIRNLRS